jgi:hypothetical protein
MREVSARILEDGFGAVTALEVVNVRERRRAEKAGAAEEARIAVNEDNAIDAVGEGCRKIGKLRTKEKD